MLRGKFSKSNFHIFLFKINILAFLLCFNHNGKVFSSTDILLKLSLVTEEITPKTTIQKYNANGLLMRRMWGDGWIDGDAWKLEEQKLVNHWLVTRKIVFCKANDIKYNLVRLCLRWELSRNTTKTKFSFLLIFGGKKRQQVTQQDEEKRKAWKEKKTWKLFFTFSFCSVTKKKEKQYPEKEVKKKLFSFPQN